MKSVIKLPQQRGMVLAVASAIVGLASASAQADCVSGGTIASNSVGINWVSGNCTVNTGVILANRGQLTALSSSSSVGTLTNSGKLLGAEYGLMNNGTIGLVDNRPGGTIAGASSGAGILNNGSIGALSNSGNISAGSTGVRNAGTVGTLTNTGLINGGGGFGYNGFNGIFNIGAITQIDNLAGATISGANIGIANSSNIITLNNSGTITGGSSSINNSGAIGTLTNSGVIKTTGLGAAGVRNAGSITRIDNLAGGVISANTAMTNSGGTIGTLNNSGTITGTVVGVRNSSQLNTITNNSGGTIFGRTAIYNSGTGAIGVFSNSGTISGTLFAFYNAAGGTLGSVSNTGLIAGNIFNGASGDLTISGGSGTIFGTLTGSGGGIGAGNTGTITNTASNLVFSSGNQLLNDNINVGSNALNNTAATLQVNSAIGITGNYSQGAGATLQIGIADNAVAGGTIGSDSGYGRLVVSGSATIAPGASVSLKPLGTYAFAAGQRFVVVDASSTGTNYNAASLVYSAGSYDGVLRGVNVTAAGHSDLVVTLSGKQNAILASVPNAVSSLSGLLGYSGIDPALLNLFNAANALVAAGDQGSANRAGVQLGPVQQSAANGAAAAPTLDALNIVAAHADSLRVSQADGAQSGVATGEESRTRGVWGQALGGHASQGDRAQTPGYSANYGGMLWGLDLPINDRWSAGGAVSYTNTAIYNAGDSAGSSTHVNAYGLIGYATYTGQPWYLNLSAGVMQQEYTTDRLINFSGFSGDANGKFSGRQYVTRAEFGYPMALGSATLTPLASLTYSNLHQNGYTESGGNGAALTVSSARAISVNSALGFKLEEGFKTSYGTLVPDMRLQWLHEYDHTRQVTGASFAADPSGETAFTSAGAGPVSNEASLSFGVTLLRANNLSLTARYELQAGGGFVSQTGSLRLRQLF
jgi:outer membrane autotransporter protein